MSKTNSTIPASPIPSSDFIDEESYYRLKAELRRLDNEAALAQGCKPGVVPKWTPKMYLVQAQMSRCLRP